eukprot:TRINITY_DN14728_c0_g1_i3.p1 TRINITY_DN14728_c0_g1~~TRINITY_DN14728_c0_g1_i3.p1  ORF type:complete len:607 (+),score=205.01 TRINITY_DN14728_c0_g1_i3:180-1823(+)
MLLKKGVRPGDRVMIYMSMTLEAQAAMLACARVGAVHVVCFGGFASTELAKRIVDCKPCLIIASSCGIPAMGKVIDYKRMLDQALQISGLSDSIPRVIVRRKELMCDLSSRVGEEDFFDLLGRSPDVADPVFLPSGAPSYIIFTSGTTGKPKGVVRDIGGYATALKWSMKAIFDLNPRDVMFTASDIGWVVGHSYILYAPLLQGCQSVVYEGKPVGTPDAGAYWRIIENHKANAMFASPTGLRAVKRVDPAGALKQGYDTTSLRHIFLAGERTDTDTLEWAEGLTGVPVYDHWWQTESGWPISAPCVGLNPSTPESKGAGLPVPGWQVAVQASEGDEAGPHTLSQGELEDATEMGSIVVKRPLPPGMLSHLWETPEEVFAEKYLTADRSAYVSGDAGYIDREGHVHIMARTDDIMNVSAIRVSTGSIEEAMAHHPSVAEGVVVGQRDSFKGEAPVAFYTLKAGVGEGSDVLAELNKLITTHVGGFARLKAAVHVQRLPKTRSGKTLRVTLRRMVNNDEYTVPVAIEDDTVLDEVLSQIASAFRRGDL